MTWKNQAIWKGERKAFLTEVSFWKGTWGEVGGLGDPVV